MRSSFYHINDNLEPDCEIPKDEYFVYVNYFGIKDSFVNGSEEKKKLIIDCCQAFYSTSNHMSFYSPRKFFPVADGGYLKFDSEKFKNKYEKLPLGESCESHDFFYKNKKSDQESYSKYKHNEINIENSEVKKMSVATQSLLDLVDFEKLRQARVENFAYLHDKLGCLNELKINIQSALGPMVYPLLTSNLSREDFIKNKVFVAHYWKNIGSNLNNFEKYLSKNLIPLPIDHRYGIKHMKKIVDLINSLKVG
ncbi:hypothetical protein [Piscirickettsia litoralis]|uniref:Uncharacterized protein n=1 Tax=Piscirickettsia litoralis TaxID=1891921 RepID=A0ABX3A7R0_9GAMM|nr:hypothetical protein [Piscirickettsia litoralis]ODN43746.1 hypothetical protein BGC07_13635 [Piscirickettsia litoralis]